MADAFQAKAAAKRKRQEEARAALAAAAASGQALAPSPAKKSRVLGDLAPRPCTSPPVAQAAAAAARVVPSGQGSPSSRGAGAPPPSRRKQQHPTAVASGSVADSSSRERQAEQEERQQRQAAGRATMRAPSTGRTKQQTLSPTKNSKSRGSGRTTGGKQVPEVLQQADQEPVAPVESGESLGQQAWSFCHAALSVTARTKQLSDCYLHWHVLSPIAGCQQILLYRHRRSALAAR